MSDELIVILVVVGVAVLVAVIAFLAWRASRRRRTTDQLHDRFGPEYDRVVGDANGRRGRRSAEAELADRADQRDRLDIRPLDVRARERYAARWRETQATFVDAPAPALDEAEALLQQVMAERGYPVESFEEQSALISVDHPGLVENYREAHATRAQIRQGGTDTEALRSAMLRYRSLFDELLAEDDNATSGTDQSSGRSTARQ
jgi:hypothetical protein